MKEAENSLYYWGPTGALAYTNSSLKIHCHPLLLQIHWGNAVGVSPLFVRNLLAVSFES